MNYPGLTLRHLVRNPRRSLLLLGSFALGAFVFATLCAIPDSINRVLADAARGLRLIVIAPNSYRLPTSYCDEIRRMPHVAACMSEVAWTGTYRSPHHAVLTYGVDGNLATVYSDSVHRVPADEVADFQRDKRGVLVGPVLMHKYGWRLGQHIALRGLDASHITLNFIVTGETPVLQAPNVIIFRRSLLDEAVKKTYNFNLANTASFLVVRVDGAKWITPVIIGIDARFHNSDAPTQTMTESDAKANNISAVGDLRPIIYALCALVMITTLMVAANSMAMAARERVSEVAVMRALGFSSGRVVALMLAEAAVLGGVGGAMGAGAAYMMFRHGITLGVVVGNTGYMAVAPPVALFAAGLVTILSVASAAIPALGTVRVAPALAFRQVA